MTTTRAAATDEHGVRHRYGCTRPGWNVETLQPASTIVVAHCLDCGVLRIQQTQRRTTK